MSHAYRRISTDRYNMSNRVFERVYGVHLYNNGVVHDIVTDIRYPSFKQWLQLFV